MVCPPSRPAASECPPDIRISFFESLRASKKQIPEWVSAFLGFVVIMDTIYGDHRINVTMTLKM